METQKLAGPDIIRLWCIGGANNVVRWLELLAAALFTFELTGSGFAVAAVTAARTLPMMLFGAFAGVVSDAIDRKRILMVGMLITATVSATICALGVLGLAEPWHIGVASFLCGTVWSTEMSSRRRMVGDTAAPGMLARVIAVDSLAGATTRMVGPLLAGVTYELGGLPGAYLITTLLSLGNFFLARPIRHHQIARSLSLASVFDDLREGLRAAISIPQIAAVLAVTVAMNMFGFCYSALIAPLALKLFSAPNAMVGVLGAAESAGALLAGMMLTRRTPRTPPRLLMISGSVLFVVCLMLLPLAPGFWTACVLLVLGGTGTAAFSNMQTLLVISGAPSAMRSRLLGLITVCIGTGPLGQLAIGALADGVGLRAAVEIMAGTGLVAILAIGLVWRLKDQSR